MPKINKSGETLGKVMINSEQINIKEEFLVKRLNVTRSDVFRQ